MKYNESSPGKHHRYLLTEGLSVEEFRPVQARLVVDYGSDKNAQDPARVLRFPGFCHRKVDSEKGLTGEPFMVRIVHESGALPYTREQILKALPPIDRKGDGSHTADEGTVKIDDRTYKALRSALAFMRADDREPWVRMGHALKDLGDVGRGLWLEWSQISEKYDPPDAARVWDSFKPEHTGYAAVFAEAQRQGWVNPAMGVWRNGEEPPPWEDPPIEAYANDPESQGLDRDSGTRRGDSGDSGEKAHEDSFSGWRQRGDWWRLFLERAKEILLSNSYEPQDYPIHALGPLSEVCAGIAERGQMTTAMSGQCVLGSAALLCQSRADVRTLAGVKPLSLYLLTIGESGSGKTTGEEIALKPVIGYQRRATKEFKQTLADYEEALARRKKGDSLPEKPREPYLIMKDGTVEGIRRSFAEGLPSQGVFTSEAAVLLSGYGMRRENQAKTAAEFNHLFDHGEISVSRSVAGRIQLYDRRLSLHWMLQPEAAYEGLHNPLLSKMGFWPRFLFAWPPPSQPRKAVPFRPEQDSRIREYWERCQALLNYPLGEDCADLPVLEATPEAEGLACRFFEQMEVAAKSKDGILRDARAFALRATELAFRVAGELVIFRSQDRLRTNIDLKSMRNGIELVAYSLETWRAAHGDRHETEMRSDAFRLYEWLLNQPQVSALETSILHIGPRATRSRSRRDTALSLLQQAKLVFCEGRTWKAKIE